MSVRSRTPLKFIFLWLVFLLTFVSGAAESSVREVTLDEMIQQSKFVFEGRVLDLDAIQDNPRRIYTYVTFEIFEIVKGEYPETFITLRFLGGTVGNVTMAVSDMHMPDVGEHGIYFVESQESSQAHPLYGWSQGHFIVEEDETGIGRVLTNQNQMLVEVRNDNLAAQESPGEVPLPTLSGGLARGIIVSQGANNVKGLTAQEFKTILQEKLKKSQ
jgi:hypothetical protein